MKELVLNVCFLHLVSSHMKVRIKKFNFFFPPQVCCMTIFKPLCLLSHRKVAVIV